ncbi:cohesin domain-containing protein [Methylocaldum gracile]|jgi:hypothetical protein|uniref:cohesin domain-containing protein n=1 Tax=Methylocaldum sp. 0917 TaxID=2485163 RepID=UPI00105B4386
MNKLLKILGLAVPLSLLAAQPASAISLVFNPVSQDVALGDPAKVDVIVTDLNNQLVGTYDFNVHWNDSILSLASVDFDTFLDGPFDSFQGFDDSVSGTVNVFEISLDLLTNQDGNTAFRLFTLTFNTLANGLSPLSFTDNIASTGEFLGDENGDPFVPPVSAGRGSVCVGGNCQQSQPIPVPEPPVVMLMGAGLLGFAFNQRHRRAGVR